MKKLTCCFDENSKNFKLKGFYIDYIRGFIGFGKVYGEHSCNFRPFPNEDFLVSLADKYYRSGKFNDSLKYYKLILSVIDSSNNASKKAELMIKIGQTYSEKGSFNKALSYLTDALKIIEKQKSKGKLIEVFGLIGETYRKKADFKKAKIFYLKAFKIAQNIKNDTLEKGVAYHYMAKYYQSIEEHNRAYSLLNKALKIFEKLNYKYGIASVYNNMGIHCFKSEKNVKKALYYFKKSLEIFKELDLVKDIHSVEYNIYCVENLKNFAKK